VGALDKWIQQLRTSYEYARRQQAEDDELERAQFEADKRSALEEIWSAAPTLVNDDERFLLGNDPTRVAQLIKGRITQAQRQTVADMDQDFLQYQQQKLQDRHAQEAEFQAKLERLQNLSSTGLKSLLDVAPAKETLRYEMVLDPATGQIQKRPRTDKSPDDIRAEEIADYIGAPADVVKEQLADETMKELSRQSAVENYLYSRDQRQYRAQARAEQRALAQAKLQESLQRASTLRYQASLNRIKTFATMPEAAVQDTLTDPNAPPEAKVDAVIARNIRNATQLAKADMADKAFERTVTSIALKNTLDDPVVKTLVLSDDDPAHKQQVINEKISGFIKLLKANPEIAASFRRSPTFADDEIDQIYNPVPENEWSQDSPLRAFLGQ
jgi:hypothetical protein